MKSIVVLLLLVPGICFAQSDTLSLESLNKKILQLNANHNELIIATKKASLEQEAGSLLIVAGLVLYGLDLFVFQDERDANGKPYDNKSRYLSFGLVFSGTILHIDSHRWIKRKKRPII